MQILMFSHWGAHWTFNSQHHTFMLILHDCCMKETFKWLPQLRYFYNLIIAHVMWTLLCSCFSSASKKTSLYMHKLTGTFAKLLNPYGIEDEDVLHMSSLLCICILKLFYLAPVKLGKSPTSSYFHVLCCE